MTLAIDIRRAKPVEWPEPSSLESVAGRPFPVTSVPGPASRLVSEAAETYQTDPAMPAVGVLAVLAAVAQNRVTVEVRTGWREALVVDVVAVAPSGDRKSPVVAEVTRPLRRIEQDLAASLAEDVDRNRSVRKALEGRIARAEKRAVDLSSHEERAAELESAIALRAQLRETPEICTPQLSLDDCTLEAAAQVLARQGGSGAIISAEAGIIGMFKGRYSDGGANIDLPLKGHVGEALSIHRVTREPIHLERPTLSMLLFMQPSAMVEFAGDANLRGRGLFARFLPAWPPSKVGSRSIETLPISEDARAEYEDAVRRLHDLKPSVDPPALHCEPAAWEQLKGFAIEIEPQLGRGGILESAGIADFGSKLTGQVARLAGLIHLAEHGLEGSISAETMRRGIALGWYFHGQALRVAVELGLDRNVTLARVILDWLRKPIEMITPIRQSGVVSRREIHQGHRTRFPHATDIDAPVRVLVDTGWLRPAPGLAHRFEVNPKVWGPA